MPRLKYIFPTHLFCHECKIVVPITYEAATEISKHVNHKCEYTRMTS